MKIIVGIAIGAALVIVYIVWQVDVRWLLVIPAVPVVAYLIFSAFSLWNGWRNGAECLGCGHHILKGDLRECPNHGAESDPNV